MSKRRRRRRGGGRGGSRCLLSTEETTRNHDTASPHHLSEPARTEETHSCTNTQLFFQSVSSFLTLCFFISDALICLFRSSLFIYLWQRDRERIKETPKPINFWFTGCEFWLLDVSVNIKCGRFVVSSVKDLKTDCEDVRKNFFFL